MRNTKLNALNFIDHKWPAWPCGGRGYTADMLMAYARAVAPKKVPEKKGSYSDCTGPSISDKLKAYAKENPKKIPRPVKKIVRSCRNCVNEYCFDTTDRKGPCRKWGTQLVARSRKGTKTVNV